MRSYVSPRTKAIGKKNVFSEEYLQPDSPGMMHSDSSYLRNKAAVSAAMMQSAMSNPYDYLNDGMNGMNNMNSMSSMNGMAGGYENNNAYYYNGGGGGGAGLAPGQQNMLTEQVSIINLSPNFLLVSNGLFHSLSLGYCESLRDEYHRDTS